MREQEAGTNDVLRILSLVVGSEPPHPTEPDLGYGTSSIPVIKVVRYFSAEFKSSPHRAAWVAQSIKCPTLDFGASRDLRVVSSSPKVGSILGMEPA